MTTLAQVLTPIVKTLDENNASDLKPVQKGDKRIQAVQAGLQALADFFSFPVNIRETSTGDIEFFGKDGGKGYGQELADILSQYYTRTGVQATKGHVLPQNGWTRINHFEAEKLIREQAVEAGKMEAAL